MQPNNYKLHQTASIKSVHVSGKDTLIIRGVASMYTSPETGMLVLDRDNELVNVHFMDLESFKKNPIMLFQHDPKLPIGRVTEIENRQGTLMITAEISRLTGMEHIFEAVEKGIVKSLSVGFIAKELALRELHDEDIIEISKSELVEISLTSAQSNPEAIFDVIGTKSPSMLASAFATQNGLSEEELKEKLLTLQKEVNMDAVVQKETEVATPEVKEVDAVVEVTAAVKVEPKVEEKVEVAVEVKPEVETKPKEEPKLLDEKVLADAIVAANLASETAIKQKEEADKQAKEEAEANATAAAKARVDDVFAYIKEQQELIINIPDDEFDAAVVEDFYELVSDATDAIQAKVLGIINDATKEDPAGSAE